MTMYIKQGRNAIKRQIITGDYVKSLHHSRVKVPHLYLSVIGIDERYRGKGLASSLILPMLEKSDLDSLPCHLTTYNECNIGLYKRFGFRVAYEAVIHRFLCTILGYDKGIIQ